MALDHATVPNAAWPWDEHYNTGFQSRDRCTQPMHPKEWRGGRWC